jgi:Protein of unknown function (DUF1064).
MANHREEWTKAVTKLQMTKAVQSKYKAVKVTVDGIVFDSKREAARYHELKLMEKAGKIRNLRLQTRWPLVVQKDGELSVLAGVQVGVYMSDFDYEELPSGAYVVEDSKGVRTALYRWKAKHMAIQYGIQIREV